MEQRLPGGGGGGGPVGSVWTERAKQQQLLRCSVYVWMPVCMCV